ncbi:hypothetical protein AAVH_21297 [Aphelenchoides avenae]|nr:hypothetical protein AAVH_21297 [Aphelenchus avenae]
MFLDKYMFDLLLPVKDAWRDGHVYVPRCCSSQSLFERAFSELFFCKSMQVSIPVVELSQPFLSHPAIRECTSLDIAELSRPLLTLEIVEWLHVDARSKEPKSLEMSYDVLGDSVEDLVEQLKKDFVESKTACSYVTVIYLAPPTSYDDRFINKDTLEELIICDEPMPSPDVLRVKVQRKPMGQKQ